MADATKEPEENTNQSAQDRAYAIYRQYGVRVADLADREVRAIGFLGIRKIKQKSPTTEDPRKK